MIVIEIRGSEIQEPEWSPVGAPSLEHDRVEEDLSGNSSQICPRPRPERPISILQFWSGPISF